VDIYEKEVSDLRRADPEVGEYLDAVEKLRSLQGSSHLKATIPRYPA